MKTKFTQGEWENKPIPTGHLIRIKDEKMYVAQIDNKGQEAEANAKLIAAAPELLKLAEDFCITFKSTIGYQKYEVNVFTALNDRYIQAREAIKKATL